MVRALTQKVLGNHSSADAGDLHSRLLQAVMGFEPSSHTAFYNHLAIEKAE